jgi:hypothetical protein
MTDTKDISFGSTENKYERLECLEYKDTTIIGDFVCSFCKSQNDIHNISDNQCCIEFEKNIMNAKTYLPLTQEFIKNIFGLDYLKQLHYDCREYVADPKYVYKFCADDKSNGWIVVLKRLPESSTGISISTVTNEKRKNVVDKNYAKFRGNAFLVVDIFNHEKTNKTNKTNKMSKNNSIINYGSSIVLPKPTTYTIGEIIKADKYCTDDIDVVCTNGIHFFTTLNAAYFYGSSYVRYQMGGHIGYWRNFNDDGEIISEGIDNYVFNKYIASNFS